MCAVDTLGLGIYHEHATRTAHVQALTNGPSIAGPVSPKFGANFLNNIRVAAPKIGVSFAGIPVVIIENKQMFRGAVGMVGKVPAALRFRPYGVIRSPALQRGFYLFP